MLDNVIPFYAMLREAVMATSPMFFLAPALVGIAIAVLIRLVIHRKPQGGLVSPSLSTPHHLSTTGEKQEPPVYRDHLPPSRKEFSNGMLKASFDHYPSFTEEQIRRPLLPFKSNYTHCQGALYTPTGFSVVEIKNLGDFPDYAALSGVPLPKPYLQFDITRAIPRPYRPFRWSYHQTMSLSRLEPDWWIELESTYERRVAQRLDIWQRCGKDVLDYLPGSELACKELMEITLQFLCARYPHCFHLSEDKQFFSNNILGKIEDLRAVPPMEILMANVPEDFAIMMRDEETGEYYLRAGAVCSSLGWNLRSKMGLQLHEIHSPIPDYKEKMQFSMSRYFSKMPTDKPIQRGSWGLETGMPLYMPPGDPHELLRLSQDPNLKLSDCHLRVDWQSLRRLPLSGAIVFSYRALFTPVTEFKDEPRVPALMVKILGEAKKSIMEYKNTWHVEHRVLPACKEWAKEQEEKGVVKKDWEVCTLVESPFFEGWENKWHRQQGF